MGLFNRKTSEQQHRETMTMLDDIGAGRGFTGRAAKAFLGADFTASVQQAATTMHQAEEAAALQAAGMPTSVGRVVGVVDTGQTINDNPNVVLSVELDGRQLAITTLVPRIAIPRVGDQVRIVTNPSTGAPLYAGLARM